MVEPAHGLVAPFQPRAEVSVIGERMIPRAYDNLGRNLRLHEHVGNVVTVAILQTANQKTWNRDLAQGMHAVTPEWTVVLMLQIKQRPRRRIEARPQYSFIERIIRCPDPTLCQVHVQFELINVRHAVNKVNVIVKQLARSMDRNN